MGLSVWWCSDLATFSPVAPVAPVRPSAVSVRAEWLPGRPPMRLGAGRAVRVGWSTTATHPQSRPNLERSESRVGGFRGIFGPGARESRTVGVSGLMLEWGLA